MSPTWEGSLPDSERRPLITGRGWRPAAPPLPKRRSPRTRLLKAAHDNGWRWDFVSGGGDQFTHEDGSVVHVTFYRGSLNSGVLHMPERGGAFVDTEEVWRILEDGLRCICTNYLPDYPDYLAPDPKCELKHRYEHMEIEGLTIRPIFCLPERDKRCGYCVHCTWEATARVEVLNG